MHVNRVAEQYCISEKVPMHVNRVQSSLYFCEYSCMLIE